MKKIKTILAILIIMSISAVSHADPLVQNGSHDGHSMAKCGRCGKERMQMFEAHMQKLQKDLNLSNAQMEQIRKLKKEGFEAVKNARKNLKNPMIEATKSGVFDKGVFVSAATDNAKVLAQIRAEHMEKFYNILTPEQRQKFIEIMKDKREHRVLMQGE